MTSFRVKDHSGQNAIAWHGLLSYRNSLVMIPWTRPLPRNGYTRCHCHCAFLWHVLLRLLRFYAHARKIFGGEGLRKSHEGASSPLQERRRGQTKGFAKATKIPSKNALHSLLHHRLIVVADFNISRMCFAERFTTTRFHARMRCILCSTIDWLSLLLSTFQECYWPSYYYGRRFPDRATYGRRFPDRATRQWVTLTKFYYGASLPLIELPTGVASLIELHVNALHWPSFTRQCVTLTKFYYGASLPLIELHMGVASLFELQVNVLHWLTHRSDFRCAFELFDAHPLLGCSCLMLNRKCHHPYFTWGGVIVYFLPVYLYDIVYIILTLFVAQHALFYSPISHGGERLSIR